MSAWLDKAKMTLYDLTVQQNAVANLPDMIKTLQNEAYGIKAAQTDKVVVSGGGNTNADDKLIAEIVKLDELKLGYKLALMEATATTNALNVLTEEERIILDAKYVHQLQTWEEYLMDVLHIERATVYRKLKRSLRRYCIARFGTY